MYRLFSFVAVGLLSFALMAPAANAQYSWNVDNNQARMQARITAGANSGRLTRSEVSSLQRKMSQINQMEAMFRNSGSGLSFSERTRLNYRLQALNSQISNQLNDADTRWNNRNRGGWNNNRGDYWNNNRHNRWSH